MAMSVEKRIRIPCERAALAFAPQRNGRPRRPTLTCAHN